MTIRIATTPSDYHSAATLFQEYAAWLGINLCFQQFDEELNVLPVMYGNPEGALFLISANNVDVACVGVRKIGEQTAELKRMFVKDEFRGKGYGQLLLDAAIAFAREAGYQKIQLDTLRTMTPAMNLYKKNKFVEIPAYYHNPIESAVYFELKLD